VKRKLLTVGLFAVMLALPAIVQAANITNYFDYSGKLNQLKFKNYETFVDTQGNFVNPAAAKVGDLLVSIFRATDLYIEKTKGSSDFSLPAVWQANTGKGYFFAYSLQQIATINPGAALPILGMTFANPAADPFNILSAGAQAALFVSNSDWTVTGANLAADIASATSGSLWGEFGITANPATRAIYQGINIGTLLGNTDFNLDAVGPLPAGISQFDRTRTGGSDFQGRAIVSQLVPPLGQWIAESQDPMTFAVVVPEPATLAMWGGFLAIGAEFALRRRTK
jgi:hypothetical protein